MLAYVTHILHVLSKTMTNVTVKPRLPSLRANAVDYCSTRVWKGFVFLEGEYRYYWELKSDQLDCVSCIVRRSRYYEWCCIQLSYRRPAQGRSQDFTFGGHISWAPKARESRSRRLRGGRNWGGMSPSPNRLGDLGERREILQRGPGLQGGAAATNAFLAYLRPTEHFW